MDDPKAIEACVKALNSSLESVGANLAIATAFVVAGLLIEYWDDAIAEAERLARVKLEAEISPITMADFPN